jgi:hypothetical protein
MLLILQARKAAISTSKLTPKPTQPLLPPKTTTVTNKLSKTTVAVAKEKPAVSKPVGAEEKEEGHYTSNNAEGAVEEKEEIPDLASGSPTVQEAVKKGKILDLVSGSLAVQEAIAEKDDNPNLVSGSLTAQEDVKVGSENPDVGNHDPVVSHDLER